MSLLRHLCSLCVFLFLSLLTSSFASSEIKLKKNEHIYFLFQYQLTRIFPFRRVIKNYSHLSFISSRAENGSRIITILLSHSKCLRANRSSLEWNYAREKGSLSLVRAKYSQHEKKSWQFVIIIMLWLWQAAFCAVNCLIMLHLVVQNRCTHSHQTITDTRTEYAEPMACRSRCAEKIKFYCIIMMKKGCRYENHC